MKGVDMERGRKLKKAVTDQGREVERVQERKRERV